MPLSQYDKYFGGKPGNAAKAAAALREEYGSEKGQQVFYAIVAKRKHRGDPRGAKARSGGRTATAK